MKATDETQIARDVRSLISSGSHRCSICGEAFKRRGVFFAGTTPGGKPALTRVCCKRKLDCVLVVGFYRPTALVPTALAILRRGGVAPTPETLVDTAPNRWKRDDSAWFKANPARSHRLRLLAQDEALTLPPDVRDVIIPPRHEIQAIIRQVEPGKRIRRFVVRNCAAEIPDSEEVLHALFDMAGSSPEQGLQDARITKQDLERGAQKLTPTNKRPS